MVDAESEAFWENSRQSGSKSVFRVRGAGHCGSHCHGGSATRPTILSVLIWWNKAKSSASPARVHLLRPKMSIEFLPWEIRNSWQLEKELEALDHNTLWKPVTSFMSGKDERRATAGSLLMARAGTYLCSNPPQKG